MLLYSRDRQSTSTNYEGNEVSAVLKPTETPDLSAGLAAIRKGIADATAALNRAESERARCEGEAVQLQAIVDRLPVFREKLAALYEAQASGDESAAKKIVAVEKDLETQVDISGRAELNLRGVKAAARKFQQRAADAEAQIESLRGQAKDAALAILIDVANRSRNEYRADCRRFAAEAMLRHAVVTAAVNAFAQDVLGLSKAKLLAADLHTDDRLTLAVPITVTNDEQIRGEYRTWADFNDELAEPLSQRVAELTAKLRTDLGLPE